MNTTTTMSRESHAATAINPLETIGGMGLPRQSEPSSFDEKLEVWRRCRVELSELPLEAAADDEDRLCNALEAAERKLMGQRVESASDLRALAEIIWPDPSSIPPRQMMTTFFAALRQLDRSASRTFDPKAWVSQFKRGDGGWVERDGEILLLSPTPQSDLIAALFWEMETRGARELVENEIRRRAAVPDGPQSAWTKAVSAYQATKAELDAHQFTTNNSKLGTDECTAYENKTERLANKHSAALEALFVCPSPNAEALRFKLRLFASEQLSDWHRNHEFADLLATEADRLLS